MKKNVSASLLWMGAAISVAEILTGVIIAPLGLEMGIAASLIGHFIGCVPLFFVALAGAKSDLPTMKCTRSAFGKGGSYVFSVLNILQLVGWTAVMIFSGAAAMASFGGTHVIWCIVIGALIAVWCIAGLKNVGKLNVVCVTALFILCVILAVKVFGAPISQGTGEISFGAAVELSAAMPLSWLPLIADYTKGAKKSTAALSVGAYFIGSNFMYIIGIGAVLCFGVGDLSAIFAAAGLGIAGAVIVVLSTVTTTFLDAYSAGVSAANLSAKLNEKVIAVIVAVIGTVLAAMLDVTRYEDFLYLIGSAFAPMTAVFIVDYFICKKHNFVLNLIVWAIGVVIYRLFLNVDFVLGTTLPSMVITGAIAVITNLIWRRKNA